MVALRHSTSLGMPTVQQRVFVPVHNNRLLHLVIERIDVVFYLYGKFLFEQVGIILKELESPIFAFILEQ